MTPENLNEKPISTNETVPKTEFVDEETINYVVNSSEGVDLFPEIRDRLEYYFKNKKLTPDELKYEIIQFDKIAKLSKFFGIMISDEDIKCLLGNQNISAGIYYFLENHVSHIPFEDLSSLFSRLTGEMDELIPLIQHSLYRAQEIYAEIEGEYLSSLLHALNLIIEKFDQSPTTIARVIELQDDFKLLAYKIQPIVEELTRGPFRNLAFKLEESLQPISRAIIDQLDLFKDKALASKINLGDKFMVFGGKFFNPRDFYEANS